MNEIDEILGTNSQLNNNKQYSTNRNYSNRQSNKNYKNQDNWKQQLQQERQKIYNSMDKMAETVSQDSQKFKQYLDIQSRFAKYSVGNCLVILEKAPYSTQIRDEKSWKEKGVNLIDNAKAIKILEPSRANNGRIYYNPKDVYDVTQTTATKPSDIEYGVRELLESIVYTCDVPRKQVDQLPDGRIGSQYSKEENLLYVCKGMDKELLFQTLFQEIANIEMRDEGESNIKGFRSYCVSYMMCKKYGIDVASYDFKDLPEEIAKTKEAKEIRKELDIIRNNFENINSKMEGYLQKETPEKSKSVPER